MKLKQAPEFSQEMDVSIQQVAQAMSWDDETLRKVRLLYATGLQDGFAQARRCADCNGSRYQETIDVDGKRALVACRGCWE